MSGHDYVESILQKIVTNYTVKEMDKFLHKTRIEQIRLGHRSNDKEVDVAFREDVHKTEQARMEKEYLAQGRQWDDEVDDIVRKVEEELKKGKRQRANWHLLTRQPTDQEEKELEEDLNVNKKPVEHKAVLKIKKHDHKDQNKKHKVKLLKH